MRRTTLRGPCPACGGEIEIRSMACNECGTHLQGRFQRCEFCRLSPEVVAFVRVFLARRGVLREVEKELGVSYPTVRSMLDSALQQLGVESRSEPAAAAADEAAPPSPPSGPSRKEVLDRLSRKEISVDEALQLLRGGSKEAGS